MRYRSGHRSIAQWAPRGATGDVLGKRCALRKETGGHGGKESRSTTLGPSSLPYSPECVEIRQPVEKPLYAPFEHPSKTQQPRQSSVSALISKCLERFWTAHLSYADFFNRLPPSTHLDEYSSLRCAGLEGVASWMPVGTAAGRSQRCAWKRSWMNLGSRCLNRPRSHLGFRYRSLRQVWGMNRLDREGDHR